METHETIGFIVLGIILLLLVWRIILKGGPVQRLSWLYLLLGIGGVGLMVYGASLGGEMVYTHGVAVKAVPVSEAEAGHHHDLAMLDIKSRASNRRIMMMILTMK